MKESIKRALLVWIVSSIAIIFVIMMLISNIFNFHIEFLQFIGIYFIVGVLNFFALLRIMAWYYIWDGIIPKIDGKKISEIEK